MNFAQLPSDSSSSFDDEDDDDEDDDFAVLFSNASTSMAFAIRLRILASTLPLFVNFANWHSALDASIQSLDGEPAQILYFALSPLVAFCFDPV